KEGYPCDADGSFCTAGDACKQGTRQKGAALNCDDSNVCTVDSCNPTSGCLHLAATAPCDADGDACTVGDVCDSKLCVAGPKKNCDDGDLCTADACDSGTAACSHTAIVGCGGNCAADADCDDKNACTADSCSKGKCTYAAAAGTCDDGNVCTKGDACASGKCSGTAQSCDDGKVCTTDSCDPATGCKYADNLADCDDGDSCTTGDQCKAGSCGAGQPKICDDGDKCTKDTCNPADGSCKFTGIPGCGIYCAGSADCDDKNPCTDQSCQGGKCVWVNNTLGCDDTNPCTVSDVCNSAKCVPGAAKNCNDNNACTADSCDSSNGNCVNASVPATTTCDDGNACTSSDACGGTGPTGKATCVGTAKNCNDGNACTTDSCVVASGGCVNSNNTVPCDDGNPCTPGDTCAGGKCVAGSQLTIDTLAGSGSATYADGTGAAASFYYPYGIAADASGNAYVADTYNHRIRKVTPAGVTTTIAGNAAPGYTDGKGTLALFNLPFGIAIDKSGTLYVADYNNNVIRKIATDGAVTTFAGTGAAGYGDGAPGVAKFNHPTGVAVGPGGLLAVADYANHRIRLIDSKGNVTTLAGSGSAAFADHKDGSKAAFYYPLDLRFDASGTLYVADQYNHRIRMVTPAGTVSTIAGNGVAGIQDGDAANARFYYPWGIAVSPDGAVFVGDRYNHRIRKIFAGKVSTFAGTGVAGWLDGQAILGRFQYPAAIAFDPAGYLYIGDGNNHRIRRIRDGAGWCQIGSQCSTAGWPNPSNSCQICDPTATQSKWTTLADASACDDGELCTQSDACAQGKCSGSPTACDDGDSCTLDSCNSGSSLCTFAPIVGCGGNCSTASDCDDKNPCTTDSCTSGKCANNNNILPCDDGNACTLGDQCAGGSCVAGTQVVASTLAGSGTYGYKDGAGAQAQFKRPFGLDFDSSGNFYVAEYDGQVIRKVAADGTVSLFAGSGTGGLADGKGVSASFYYPTDVAVGPGGKVYVADRYNHRIRVIDPDGTVSTLAGSVNGYLDGPAVSARFQEPIGIAVNGAGVVLVVEYAGHRIRRIQGGTVTTLSGNGTAGFKDGTGNGAVLNGPISIALDSAGNGIFVEYLGNRIRKVTPSGVVTTLAGTGVGGYLDGAANSAMFLNPWGVAVDPAGTIYVADRSNHRIRTLSTSGVVGKVAGTGAAGFKDGNAGVAQFNAPTGIAVDAQGQVWVGDDQNQRIRRIVDSTKPCGVGGLCYAAGMPNPANDCEVCDAGKSATAFSVAANGSACSDGKACTAPDACSNGSCTSSAVTCDDNNTCTTDSCDTQTGACLNKPILGCNGYCGQNSDCDDSNPCTTDSCANNKCQFVNNTLPCDDGDLCSVGDVCNGGSCVPGAQVWIDTPAGSVAGYKDATGTAAQFNVPLGIDALDDGTAYVADTGNHRIRKIAADGTVTTFAGSGNAGMLDAKGTAAWFSSPADIGHDAAGNLYVADRDNHAVRKIATDGTVNTLAGSGAPGYVDDKGAKAKFNTPYSLAVAPTGLVYVADSGNHRIRKVAADGTVTTLAGSTAGYADGTGAAAKFNQPIGIAIDRMGTLYVAEYAGHRLRKITAEGVVTTLAGTGVAGGKDGDPAVASFYYPWGIAVDNNGIVYVADRYNQRIRRIEPGLVSTWAGTGGAGYKDGIALQGLFNYPVNLAVSAQGAVWVADGNNSRIRRVRNTAQSCNIGGLCWSSGMDNPAQTCQVCNGAASQSKWSTKGDTSPCADGNLCTSNDTCGSGQCKGVTACDDGDACTADACDSASGACSHTAIGNCP
ncbi:MAG: SMP-30/gluconolactonase/LRE family protein, partial [Deltaproteobacteria bacterium]|nr:SMP-30/gluconolactonase/LRE family protein [Deltaproteobacteria bacterium]